MERLSGNCFWALNSACIVPGQINLLHRADGRSVSSCQVVERSLWAESQITAKIGSPSPCSLPATQRSLVIVRIPSLGGGINRVMCGFLYEAAEVACSLLFAWRLDGRDQRAQHGNGHIRSRGCKGPFFDDGKYVAGTEESD